MSQAPGPPPSGGRVIFNGDVEINGNVAIGDHGVVISGGGGGPSLDLVRGLRREVGQLERNLLDIDTDNEQLTARIGEMISLTRELQRAARPANPDPSRLKRLGIKLLRRADAIGTSAMGSAVAAGLGNIARVLGV